MGRLGDGQKKPCIAYKEEIILALQIRRVASPSGSQIIAVQRVKPVSRWKTNQTRATLGAVPTARRAAAL